LAVDREKILQAAQKYVEKKKYARAISEYQKLLVGNPNDARTLLKIGDLQARTSAYAEAVASYDRVGHYYSSQGFALKAVAVYKQIRELLEKNVPELTERYSHIIPKLAEIYAELGLLSEALGAYEEVVARELHNGREREALEVLRRMIGIDANNPLRHIRFAEACCRLQELDEAMESFAAAAELLLAAGHRDDALKVLERMLHFRQDTRFARIAAEHYLERGSSQDGLLALAKLQICFQADPRDLATLELLARVFSTIDQEQKAIEVRKEMARIAFEQGHHDAHREIVDSLLQAAPDDPQVQSLGRMREHYPAATPDVEELDADDVSLEDADVNEISVTSIIEGLDQDLAARAEREGHDGTEPLGPDALEDHSQVIEEVGFAAGSEAQTHIDRATHDAEKFRELGLYSKAIETLRIAIELEPRSVELHQQLIEILAENGDREGTIHEMITLSTLHADSGDGALAASILEQVLEAEPNHPEAALLLEEIKSGVDYRPPSAEGLGSELPAYDSEDGEGSNVDTAITVGAVHGGGSPRADRSEPAPKSGMVASRPPLDNSIEALEGALEEAEFYASCGLADDAKKIVLDLWPRFSDHPLLVERMRELGVTPPRQSGAVRTRVDASEDAIEDVDETLSLEDVDASEIEEQPESGPGETALNDDATDGQTHYDLGVAYKEMGLTDEALTELDLAARDRQQRCASCLLIGAIHREAGNVAKAIEAYSKGLAATNKTPEQELGLHYELGVLHEAQGNKEEALYNYKRVARKDPEYRDVRKKLQALELVPGKQKLFSKPPGEDDEFDKAFDDMFKD
jgi:tetratricopeptide (TPR) repeat protein